MGERRKILHLIESSEPGGAETVLINLVTGLDQDRYRPIVGLLSRDWLDTQLERRGVPFFVLENKWSYDPVFLWKLLRVIRRERVALIHAHEFMMSVYGSLAARLSGIPMIGTQHGKLYFPDRRRRLLLYRYAVAMSSWIIAVSEDLRRFMVNRINPAVPEKIITLYNGIDLNTYARAADKQQQYRREIRTELNIPPQAPVAVTVGAMKRLKGFDYLLTAVSQLKAQREDLHVILAGSGEDEEMFRRQATDLGLAERTHFVGFRDDIPGLLAAADLYICSSLSEGLSLAILEAMAVGLPVIATAVGGNPELVRNGENGFLVPPGNPEKLAEQIATLLVDKQLRQTMGDRSRNKVQAQFSLETMIENYQRIYEELLV